MPKEDSSLKNKKLQKPTKDAELRIFLVDADGQKPTVLWNSAVRIPVRRKMSWQWARWIRRIRRILSISRQL